MGQSVAQVEALKGVGFNDVASYFVAREGETFGSMADELGVSGETLRRWYREWAEEVRCAGMMICPICGAACAPAALVRCTGCGRVGCPRCVEEDLCERCEEVQR